MILINVIEILKDQCVGFSVIQLWVSVRKQVNTAPPFKRAGEPIMATENAKKKKIENKGLSKS